MKFSHKVFFSTLLIIALIFGVGNTMLLNSVFRSAMEREERVTLDENQMLRFSFGTAAASAVATAESYGMMDALSDGTIRRIGWTLESSNNCCIRISDAERGTLYLSKSFQSSRDLIGSLEENGRSWMYFFQDGRYYMQSACCVEVGQRQFYLENLRDITATIQKRNRYLMFYQLMTLVLMAFSAVAMLLLSVYLTRPMHKLSVVSRRIAGGDYQLRCTVTSRDEIGALTEDFNAMADSLETKIHQLEDASKRQEDFIASFAHELKTPLTSIIGYSDMLRSQTLLPEQQFKAANYIHSEGKRLESLSHKLLELIVYRRETYTPAAFEAQPWLSAIAAVLEPSFRDSGISLMLSAGPGVIWGEADLLESLVVNLCDNARKASPAGSVVSLIGTAEEGGYRICVRDHGSGIAPEELLRVTEPFYMVDKSRARAQNGAGLGLALCAAVAQVHGTALEFTSALGKGTTVSLLLKEGGR